MHPNTYIEKLALKRPDKIFEACLCISNPGFSELKEKRFNFLHPSEIACFDQLNFERRQKSYLLGRLCAKQALSVFLKEPDMTRISIHNGVFRQPVVRCVSRECVQVSISHCDECGGAIAFPEDHPMSIDLEKIDPKKTGLINTQCTQDELRLLQDIELQHIQLPDIARLTLLWTVKEALSKALRCGLMSPFKIFEVKGLSSSSDCLKWTFKKFAQYKSISFIVDNMACSIVMPKDTEVTINIKELRKSFEVK
ncbi:4'-phosphopantetheinyl transferase superfamily protein [bacterium]|nr:4'-phosphopantetheinyl transferase superfamily protein [bacterium]